jgi:Dolichyl-phosphate-mannose-protein mannosyltransferase
MLTDSRMLTGRTHADHPPVSLDERSLFRGLERTLASVPTAFWVAAVVVLSAGFRFLNARTSPTPWILPDEYIYAELGRHLADSGHFVVNGAPMAAWSYGPLYPILLAPVWLLTSSTAQAYAAAQLVNSVVMSSAAIFAYLLGRRALDKRSALFLAVLSVLVPSMVYSTKMMTESLAYPVFLATVLAIVRMLERPTNTRQLGALAAIGVVVLARIELVVLLPAVATAIVLVAAMLDREPAAGERGTTFLQRLLRFRLTVSLFAFGGLAALSVAAFKSNFLGGHARSLHSFDLSAVPRWLLIYLGDLDLYVGVVPFAAFIVMVALAFRRDLPRSARLVLFAAGATFVWFVVFIACYSTGPRPAAAAQDRLLFYVVPLELLAFLLWIQVGLPRPRRLALVAATLAVGAPLFIPFSEFLNGRAWGVSSGTVALVPWGLLKPTLGAGAALTAVILALSLGAVAAFLYLSPMRSPLLRMIVVTNFLLITVCVLAANSAVARKAQEDWVAPDPNWVSATVGPHSRVVGIWALPERGLPSATERRMSALLENAFIRPGTEVYAYGPAHALLWGWPPVVKQALGDGEQMIDGSGALIRADYALVGPELPIQGEEVARDPNTGLVLYRIDGSELRLR